MDNTADYRGPTTCEEEQKGVQALQDSLLNYADEGDEITTVGAISVYVVTITVIVYDYNC